VRSAALPATIKRRNSAGRTGGREKEMPVIHSSHSFNRKPEWVERIISALCYLTLGLAGLIYTIVQGKHSRSSFFRFHFLQGILLGIFSMLLGWTSEIFINLVGGILQMIPGLGPEMIMVLPMTIGVILKLSSLVLLYGVVMSLMGKEAPLPVVSKLVRQQLR
jgi:uncharacterized membrane protein